MNRPNIKLSREQLYKEIWKTPIQQLSGKYGISDVGLAKVCKRMGIPRPPRGYWRRLQTGGKPRKVRLPKAREEDKMEVELSRNAGSARTPATKSKPRAAKRPPVLADTPGDTHPLVAATLARLESAKEDQGGIVNPKAKRALDLRVSRPEIDRSLRLLDTLIKSWEAEGLSVRLIKDEDKFATFLCSGDERLQIRIEEGIEDYDPGPTDDEKLLPKWNWKKREGHRATGILTVHLDGEQTSTSRFNRHYHDRPGIPVESKAPQIWAAGMDYFEKRASYFIQLEERKRNAEAAERRRQEEWRQRQAEWKRDEEEQKLREEEQRKLQELAEAAVTWAKAQQIRKFIPICEASLKETGLDSDSIAAWTSWARSAADKVDPINRGYPNLAPPNETE